MNKPPHPSLYQVNTRVWLTELSRVLGRPAGLDDIPDRELDLLAERGFDWIWFLSVWSTGVAGQRVSRATPEWRKEFERTLSDLRQEDIAGSGFAITGYTVHPALGGDASLARLRGRLQTRGLRLMLDFVPNHTGLDHPWVREHPEYYVAGTAADLDREPQNYTRVPRTGGDGVLAHDRECYLPGWPHWVLAHGRDPYFPGWADTLQLDYSHPATQEAMMRELEKVASRCDGARCDLAMLVLPEIFERTWGRPTKSFWPQAIQRIRDHHPAFCFMAEVYWDLEWTLQQQGFDYTYDKRLYDRLIEGIAGPVRQHFHAPIEFQNKLARFLENHDETRAAATFPTDLHKAAAVATFLSPGLRFFHQGQFEGRRQRISPHLARAPLERIDEGLTQFYDRLLAVLRRSEVRDGQWRLLECVPAWDGNWTWDCFLAFAWEGRVEGRLLVVVNYAPQRSQCYVKLHFPGLACQTVRLKDLLGPDEFDLEGDELIAKGLFLDLPPWGYHIFSL